MKRFLSTPLHFLLALLLLPALAACDTAADAGSEIAPASEELNLVVDGIAADLSLSPEAEGDVRASFARHENRAHQPGFLWLVADEMQDRLSDEQKDRLYQAMTTHARLFGAFPFGPIRPHRHLLPHAVNSVIEQIPNLTAEQSDAIGVLREDARVAYEDLRQQHRDGALTNDEYREAVSALRDELKADILALLTDEQAAAFEDAIEAVKARIEELRARWQEHREASVEVMVDVLDLTDAQIEDLQTLRSDLRDDATALLTDFYFHEIDRDELRDGFVALHEVRVEELERVLTPEQFELVLIHRALVLRVVGTRARLMGPPVRQG